MLKQLKTISAIALVSAVVAISSCTKQDFGPQSSLEASTSGTLKSYAQYDIGVGIGEDSLLAGKTTSNIVKAEFNNVTPGNWLKQASLLGNTGIYNFTNADRFVNYCTSNGLGIFGHVLVWHQQQTSKYLVDSLILKPQSYVTVVTPPASVTVPNGSFENGSTTNSVSSGYANLTTSWDVQPAGTITSTVSITTTPSEVYDGSRAAKVVITAGSGTGNNYTQLINNPPGYSLTKGVTYTVSVYIKTLAAGGVFDFAIQRNSGSYDFIGASGETTTTTDYKKYTYNFTLSASATITDPSIRIRPKAIGTYFIDKIELAVAGSGSTVTNPIAPTTAQIKLRVDTNMQKYITKVVTRYAGKIKAWDVVNEPIDDNGKARTNDYDYASGIFYRAKYLGLDSMCYKAFKYARAADPNAKLFLNEYGVESNTAKLDSLIALVTRLKAMGTPIDGIGLQMHMIYNQPTTGIDNMFLKIARLGLLVRVSEADVALNPPNTATPSSNVTFIPTPILFAQQASKYRYMVESFYTNVPPAQRYGISVWGLEDKTSWLNTALKPDYPCLWDSNMNKKVAYTEFLKALQFKQ